MININQITKDNIIHHLNIRIKIKTINTINMYPHQPNNLNLQSKTISFHHLLLMNIQILTWKMKPGELEINNKLID